MPIFTENQPDTVLTLAAVQDELHRAGIVLETLPGEYRVSSHHADPKAYCTDDLADALAYGRKLAKMPSVSTLPPIGPCGKRQARRALMYRHNRAIAKKREKEGRK